MLLGSACSTAAIIAPFIKVNALRSLLDPIREGVHVRCVTRWLPRDVAAGVSDPEILDVLEERGHFSLSLVDRLHAKIFLSDGRCLVGSSNVTFAGMGEGTDGNNIEVLVEANADDPSVVATLHEILQAERPATRSTAEAARRLADSLCVETIRSEAVNAAWFPSSRRPEYAFHFYSRPPGGFVRESDNDLLADLARSDIHPGLDEEEFNSAIRSLLSEIPIAKVILDSMEDITLTRADARKLLDNVADEKFSVNDLWSAFVKWMAFFFSESVIEQEISEIALRRAQIAFDR